MVIPRVVWQTWKSAMLPPPIAMDRVRMQAENSDYVFELASDSDCAAFVREEMPSEVAEAYFLISPAFGALRADLWRYCVLYVYGGVYLDIDATLLKPVASWLGSDDSGVLFIDDWQDMTASDEVVLKAIEFPLERIPPGLCASRLAQYAMAFEPGHPFLKEVIGRVERAIRFHIWDVDSTDPTIDEGLPGYMVTGYRAHNLTGPGIWTNSIRHVLNESAASFRVLNDLDACGYRGIVEPKGHSTGELNWSDVATPLYSEGTMPLSGW